MIIDRIEQNRLDYGDFCKEYLLSETPVIIEGVKAFQMDQVTPRFILDSYQEKGKKVVGWYNLPLIDDEHLKIPQLVKRVLSREDMSLRSEPMRIFMQPRRNHTLPHYDGNSLHGFNLQVVGRKKWTITSPKTPLPTMPFNFFGLVDESFQYNSQKYDFYEFETKPGDLLFLPRYWYHEVKCTEDVNINVNWVFTSRNPDETSPLGRREAEIVKLRKMFPRLNDLFFIDDFSDYGGSGEDLIREYSKGVGFGRVCSRLVKEFAAYPTYLRKKSKVNHRIEEITTNNFDV